MTQSGTDKRRAARVPVDFEVRFTFENREHVARALNLSVDGMFLKTDYMLLQNDEIDVVFSLAGAAEPFWMRSRVVWGSWVDGHATAISGMGIQFLDPLPEQKDALERHLRNLLKS